MTEPTAPISRRITLPGHFPAPVVLEAVRPLGRGYDCRVRLANGTPEEALSACEGARVLMGHCAKRLTTIVQADAEVQNRDCAVSLSGIHVLLHQIGGCPF